MKILLACGGTGGHIFPGIAVAEAFEERFADVEIVFVGTSRGLEKEIIGKTRWRLEMIEAVSFADKGLFGRLAASWGLWTSMKGARRLLKEEKPKAVLGVGGYAAAPVLAMAAMMRIPTITLETNAVPGMANRFLGRLVDRVVVAFPGMEKYFRKKKTRWFGTPVRKDILKARAEAGQSEKLTIFVFGGSQGAAKINEGLLQALPHLTRWKERMYFIHQIGRNADPAAITRVYHTQGFSAEVYPFINEMGPIYARADFVIARAGANTVAELKALQKPSLLIPYPHSAGGHQDLNAKQLTLAGGSKMLADSAVSGESLAEILNEILNKPETLKEMSDRLSNFGGFHAAEKVVEECMRFVGEKKSYV